MDRATGLLALRKKIHAPKSLVRCLAPLRGRRVLTGGCFDILHRGHIRHLLAAKQLGDYLIVALDEDRTVRRSKGKNRPFLPLEERLEILSALECVDFVTWQISKEWPRWIEAFRPALYVKGDDWAGRLPLEEQEAIARAGGKLMIIGDRLGSSTQIIRRVRRDRKYKEL